MAKSALDYGYYVQLVMTVNFREIGTASTQVVVFFVGGIALLVAM